MHNKTSDNINSERKGSYDYWRHLFDNQRSPIERITFESEKTETKNTIKDFSFPYKLKGNSSHPPLSSMAYLYTESDLMKRFKKIIKRLKRLDIKKLANHNTPEPQNMLKTYPDLLKDEDLQYDRKSHIENLEEYNSFSIKQSNRDNKNNDYLPQMHESLEDKIMFSTYMENGVYDEIMDNTNINLFDTHLRQYESMRNFDKEKYKVLENVFYPCKSRSPKDCELVKNKTLQLYQIKKEEVEKILNLTQSLEERDDFVPEKAENKHGEYDSNHMCEIINSDQRPVKKVFIVFPRKNDFRIDLDTIKEGRDKRTTCMIKNIPNKYTQTMLTEMLDEHHKGMYDFVYLRMDFKNKCNVGYAFVNFIDYKVIPSFFQKINGKGWMKYKSNKIAELTYASIQGIENLIKKFRKSNVMCEQQEYRPKVYYRDGPFKGMEWDVINDE